MDTHFKQELDNELEKVQNETTYKRNMIQLLVTEAESLVEECGIDPDTMHLSMELRFLLVMPFTLLMNDLTRGTNILVLDSYPQGDLKKYDVPIHYEDEADEDINPKGYKIRYQCGAYMSLADESGNVSIVWVMTKTENGTSYMLIDGKWEHYGCINESELRACSKCSKRGKCEGYEAQLLQDKIDTINPTDDQLDDCNASTALEALLSTVCMTEGNVDDERWKQLKRENRKLIELNTECWDGELLRFTRMDTGRFFLCPSAARHYGFLIGYSRGKYQLYQYMPVRAMQEFLQTDDARVEENYLRLVDTTKSLEAVKVFVVNYADRFCKDNPIYTIPLSFSHAIRLRGTLNGNYDELGKALEDMQDFLTEDETDNAQAFLHELAQDMSLHAKPARKRRTAKKTASTSKRKTTKTKDTTAKDTTAPEETN